jgi:hypothetical protein
MAKLTLTNDHDEEDLRLGRIRPKKVRRLEIEARVETGATMLALPADVVKKLGLVPTGTRKVKLADGSTRAVVVDPKSRDVHVDPASPDAPLLDLLATG